MIWDRMTKNAAALVGAAAGLLGEWNVLLSVLAWMMCIDYATGLICAWRGRSPKTEGGGVSSKAGFDGLARKGLIILIVLMATLLDRAIGSGSALFQTAAASYYIANEGISILENSALLGVPYPKVIADALEGLREGDGGNAGGNSF